MISIYHYKSTCALFFLEQEIEKEKQQQLQRTLDSLVSKAKDIKNSNLIEISDDERTSTNKTDDSEPEVQIVIQPISESK